MSTEHRAGGEVRVSGRTLSGVAMPYGTVSPSFRERFLPAAFGPVEAVDITLQHDDGIVLARGATLTDSPTELSVSAILAEGAAALTLVARKALRGFSVEFRPTRERREAGVRVVERAELVGLSLVDKPAYPAAGAEVRAKSGRTLRSKMPYDQLLACECIKERGPGSGGACIPMVRFTKYAGELIADAFGEADRQHMMAVAGNFRRPLGSVKKGTLRGKSTDDGLEIEVDIPTGAVGDEIVAAHEATGVIVRPLIDYDLSEFTDDATGRTVTKPHVRAFIIGATDTREGWTDATIDYDGEARSAPVPRRRLWL